MRRLTACSALLLATTLAGCSSGGSTPWHDWQHWRCDNGVTLDFRLIGDNRMELRLDGSERLYRLQLEPSGSGALFSDGELALHTKGEQGLAYWTESDELIGLDCKAP